MSRIQTTAAIFAVAALAGVGYVLFFEGKKPAPVRQVTAYAPTLDLSKLPATSDTEPPSSPNQPGLASAPADLKPLIPASDVSDDGRYARREAPPPAKIIAFQKQDLTWLEVEERFETLREARQSDHRKVHDLQNLYASVVDPAFVDAADYPTLCAELGAWRDALPESATPLVALAGAHVRWAWEARGSGPAFMVSEEGWKLFHTRLDEARRMSEWAIELGARDGQPYRWLLTIGMAETVSDVELRRILDEGRKVDPLYVGMYEQMAIALMPRWGGEPGDVERFANETVALVPGDDGLELFGLIAYQVHCYERNNPTTILWGQYNRALLARSADVLAQRYPKWQSVVQFAAYMAMIAQNHEIAQRIRPLVGDFNREHFVFPTQQLHRHFLQWADAPEVPRQETAHFWASFTGCTGLAFESDSRRVWAGQQYGTRSAILVDSQTGDLEGAISYAGAPTSSAVFGPEQRIAVVAAAREPMVGLVICNLDDPLDRRVFPTDVKPDRLSLNPQRRQVAWVEHARDAPPRWRLLDFSTETLEAQDLPIADARSLRFLQDGKHLAVDLSEGCGLWDAATGTELIRLPTRSQRPDLQVTANSIYDVDHEGKIWTIARNHANKKICLTRHAPDGQSAEILVDNISSQFPITLSPDRKFLAVGVSHGVAGQGDAIHVFRTQDGERQEAFGGHFSPIGKLVFAPDSRKLASVALMSDVVKIWSLDSPGPAAEAAPAVESRAISE